MSLTRTIPLTLSVALLSSAGCSGGFGSGDLSGAVSFPVTTAFATSITGLSDGGDLGSVVIELAEVAGAHPDSCSAVDAGGFAVAQVVDLTLATNDGSTVAFGTYPIVAPSGVLGGELSASLVYLQPDSGVALAYASGGTVSLSQAGSSYSGTFTATMLLEDGSDAGTASGSFSAPSCL